MKLKDYVIKEQENYFSIKFKEKEILFEFDDSQERLDQYQNAVDFMKKLESNELI
jgi:hypothetical protein